MLQIGLKKKKISAANFIIMKKENVDPKKEKKKREKEKTRRGEKESEENKN